ILQQNARCKPRQQCCNSCNPKTFQAFHSISLFAFPAFFPISPAFSATAFPKLSGLPEFRDFSNFSLILLLSPTFFRQSFAYSNSNSALSTGLPSLSKTSQISTILLFSALSP